MKGFPNQVAELTTLTRALKVMLDLLDAGKNPKDDGILGEALIRKAVLGTAHSEIPIEEYLAQQRALTRKSDQSYRTRARGLRELFRVLGLIDDSGTSVVISSAGRQIAALGSDALKPEGLRLWRTAIVRMTHEGGDKELSHPYQVLLRLVAKHPGITRAKCALALEAKNDSNAELDRISALSQLREDEIIKQIRITKSNWDNAKKILPRFAEQLGDVRKTDNQKFYLADAPGTSGDVTEEQTQPKPKPQAGPRKPKQASPVTAGTIAKAATMDGWDEAADVDETQLDPAALKQRKEKLQARLHRHNLIVQKVAKTLEAEGGKLFENPFDCLALFERYGLLLEMKSLDGTEQDEIARVRDALAQLLYYLAFVTEPLAKERAVKKVACFEKKPTHAHLGWLEMNDILVIWCDGTGFDGTPRAKKDLSGHFGF